GLTAIATSHQRSASLMHRGLRHIPAVMISFNLNDGYSLEDEQNAITKVTAQLQPPPAQTLR
ncbi:hypothetical protein R0K18_36895, partial [Pantoea sp. SIMBA_133]